MANTLLLRLKAMLKVKLKFLAISILIVIAGLLVWGVIELLLLIGPLFFIDIVSDGGMMIPKWINCIIIYLVLWIISNCVYFIFCPKELLEHQENTKELFNIEIHLTLGILFIYMVILCLLSFILPIV